MPTLVFQGDSITDFGRYRNVQDKANDPFALGTGYADLCAAELLCRNPKADWKIYNTGISGNRVVDLYARWKTDTLNFAPDFISILIGVNDVWHEYLQKNGVEPERFEQVYRMLLEWTLKVRPHAKLLLLGAFSLTVGTPIAPTFCEEVAERAEITRKLAAEFGAEYLPVQPLLDEACQRAEAGYWLGDGVHPTAAGHRLIADAWLKRAEKLFPAETALHG